MTAREYLGKIPMWTKKKNTLADIRRILGMLGNPDRELSIIHVAGTNGKGSVCAYLTSALKEAGYTVGTFTSPHLSSIWERFLVNGTPVEEVLAERAFLQVKAAAEAMIGQGLNHPSFFEFLFLMAALLFSWQKVDFWVMETGLGGRLDATNVVEKPLVCVITSISLEHTQYLGHTIEEIAWEKAGIIKKQVPVVYDGNCKMAAEVIRDRARVMEAEAYGVVRADFSVAWADDPYQGLIIREKGKAETIAIPFPALYQADNGVLAWKTLQVLMEANEVQPECRALLRRGMERMTWPGRMEEIRPGVYLDGAHNPGGVHAFVESAKRLSAKRRFVVFGAVGDKDYREMIAYLCQGLRPDLALIAHIQSDRDVKTDALEECFAQEGCPAKCFSGSGEAMTYVLSQKEEDDLVFCLGSLYLIGEIRGYFEGTWITTRRKND